MKNFRSGWGGAAAAKAKSRTEHDLPVSMPPRASPGVRPAGRIQVRAGPRPPAAVPGAQRVRGSGAQARACALGSGPARQHPSPQRRPHGRSASLLSRRCGPRVPPRVTGVAGSAAAVLAPRPRRLWRRQL